MLRLLFSEIVLDAHERRRPGNLAAVLPMMHRSDVSDLESPVCASFRAVPGLDEEGVQDVEDA
ncbi:hypothetical protein AZE42_03958 [Rhizopogon vesiculosus]|uniref:Uncharacterized protein n=1 Tax=Rhizopogon vesiculosus TaxID=180088 RepID=A0A1J8QDG4_9AGAM|nr:hypothetical protein AZE42_03958 [Rhizopogon vesiculosus]